MVTDLTKQFSVEYSNFHMNNVAHGGGFCVSAWNCPGFCTLVIRFSSFIHDDSVKMGSIVHFNKPFAPRPPQLVADQLTSCRESLNLGGNTVSSSLGDKNAIKQVSTIPYQLGIQGLTFVQMELGSQLDIKLTVLDYYDKPYILAGPTECLTISICTKHTAPSGFTLTPAVVPNRTVCGGIVELTYHLEVSSSTLPGEYQLFFGGSENLCGAEGDFTYLPNPDFNTILNITSVPVDNSQLAIRLAIGLVVGVVAIAAIVIIVLVVRNRMLLKRRKRMGDQRPLLDVNATELGALLTSMLIESNVPIVDPNDIEGT